MDYKSFLFGFEGRINRARYWLATLMILGAIIFSLLLLTLICIRDGIPTGLLSINLVGISASIQLTPDDAPAGLFPQIATLGMKLLFGWCYAAASIKRLHDRNKSGWWIVPYIVAPGLYGQFGEELGDTWTAALLNLATSIALLWGLFEMACLKGTHGSNRFGPDPLPKVQTRPRSDRTGFAAATGWDQHAELEFVPHSAGPSAGAHVMREHD